MIVHTINLEEVEKVSNKAKQELVQICDRSFVAYYKIVYDYGVLGFGLGQGIKAHISVGEKPVFVSEEFERQSLKFQMAIDHAHSSKPATREELEKQEAAIEKAVARARSSVDKKPATREELEKQKTAFEKAVAHSNWKIEEDRLTWDDNNRNFVLFLTVVFTESYSPVH